ncbi:MAG: STAS domain-containing protein [Solirubrobacterales bacterium]
MLRCSGELDGACEADLGAALEAACEREVEELLLDFSAVELLDGRVLALIEQARLRLERCGATLRIRPSGQPLRLLRLTGALSGDAEPRPRLGAWVGPSSSSSSPTPTSARAGEAAIR